MRLSAYQLLGGEAAGLVAAIVVLLLGVGVIEAASAVSGARGPGEGLALSVLALVAFLMGVGSLRHLATWRAVRRRHPAPGVLVDVGGHRLHVFAEGPKGRGPTVLWLPGGHIGAFAMHHLHTALKQDTRSVLLDRFGTGWSDAGPFPRTTAREVDEVMTALAQAGEPGPYIVVGHSFGGLLAANIARRHPAAIHTVVLLDPTPLEVIVLGPRLGALGAMRRDAIRRGLLLLFGIDRRAAEERRMRQEPGTAHVMDAWKTALGDAGIVLRAVDGASAGSAFASASIYRELDPIGLSRCAWQTVVYDGDLGDLPVLLVAPKSQVELDVLPESRTASVPEAERMALFFTRVRERYLATSSRSRRVVAPAGTGHNFVYEVPEFVVGLMRELVRGRAEVVAEKEPA